MRDLYRTEVRNEQAAHPPGAAVTLTEDQLGPLPDPVGRYLRSAGYIGRPIPMNAGIEWRESAIRLGEDGEFLGIATEARPVLLAVTWTAALAAVVGWGPRTLRRGPVPATLEGFKESTSP